MPKNFVVVACMMPGPISASDPDTTSVFHLMLANASLVSPVLGQPWSGIGYGRHARGTKWAMVVPNDQAHGQAEART